MSGGQMDSHFVFFLFVFLVFIGNVFFFFGHFVVFQSDYIIGTRSAGSHGRTKMM